MKTIQLEIYFAFLDSLSKRTFKTFLTVNNFFYNIALFKIFVFQFGSWTYSTWALDFTAKNYTAMDTSEYIENGEWELLGELNVVCLYNCSILIRSKKPLHEIQLEGMYVFVMEVMSSEMVCEVTNYAMDR